MYKRILVTLDGSRAAEAVLPEARKLCEATGAEMVLLIVESTPHAVAETPRPLITAGAPGPGAVVTVPGARTFESRGQAIEYARERGAAYLRRISDELTKAGLSVRTEVEFGKPVEEILAKAREIDADIIMMATHGHTGLSQVVFGSVASRVVGSGIKPVLLVRPDGLGA